MIVSNEFRIISNDDVAKAQRMIYGLPVLKNKVLEATKRKNIDKRKSSIFKCSDLWRVYNRLCDPQRPVSIIRSRYLSNHPPPLSENAVSRRAFHEDDSTCMCYENALKYVRDSCRYNSPVYNRSPYDINRIIAEFRKGFKENEYHQIPLQTLIVRWQMKRTTAGYDIPSLLDILSPFGKIISTRKLSQNSAIVMFESLTSACKVMQSPYLGDPSNKLHCRWWHMRMEDKTVHRMRKGIQIIQDPFLKKLSSFRT